MIPIHQLLNLVPVAPRVSIQTEARITYTLRSNRTAHSCHNFGPMITKLPLSCLSIEMKRKNYIFLCMSKWHENYFFKCTSRGKKTEGSSSYDRKGLYIVSGLYIVVVKSILVFFTYYKTRCAVQVRGFF